jgi:hypothetical protein
MHPVQFDAEYALERNRLTVFFRLILAIPWIVVAYVWGLLAYIGAVISWFAMMFTGRHPEGLYNFIAGFVRFSGRTAAWVTLATDEWPAFSGGDDDAYPVLVSIAPPQQGYHRAKTFFKLVLYFPQYLLATGIGVILQAAAFVSWWRIVFTGEQSATMHDALRVSLAYHVRSLSFLLLLTEIHPRMLELPEQIYPANAPALPPGTPVGGGTLPPASTPPAVPPAAGTA